MNQGVGFEKSPASPEKRIHRFEKTPSPKKDTIELEESLSQEDTIELRKSPSPTVCFEKNFFTGTVCSKLF